MCFLRYYVLNNGFCFIGYGIFKIQQNCQGKKYIFLRQPIQSLVHGNKIRSKVLNGRSKPRFRHLIPQCNIRQYEKQVNDTNVYSHNISPLTTLKIPVVPRNITIHDCCTFAKKTASAVNDVFVKKFITGSSYLFLRMIKKSNSNASLLL